MPKKWRVLRKRARLGKAAKPRLSQERRDLAEAIQTICKVGGSLELAARALAEWIRLQAEGRKMLAVEAARGDKSYPEPEPRFKVRAPESRESYQRAVRPRLAKTKVSRGNGAGTPEGEVPEREAGEAPPEEKRVAKA